MICQLSSEIPKEPVVSAKSGHVFEKRLILKFIESNGKCPITGQELTETDLISVVSGATITKPRATSATSIPSLLALFQNEWDALVLEAFHLKEKYHQSRMELSSALYEADAAKRVISRLLKERDEARAKLNSITSSQLLQDTTTSAASGTQPMDHDMDVDISQKKEEHLSAIIQIERTGAEYSNFSARFMTRLTEKRRKRKNPETLASQEQIKSFTSIAGFSSSKSAVTCTDILQASVSSENKTLILSGNKKGHVSVYDYENGGSVLFDKNGHKGAIHSVIWISPSASFASAGESGDVKIWKCDANASTLSWTEEASFKPITGTLVSMCLHPTKKFLICLSDKGSWSLVDLSTHSPLMNVSLQGVVYSSGDIHPDGMLLAAGGVDGILRIWDIKSESQVHAFEGHSGKITAVAFSENGYFLASSSESENMIRIWDLRKLINLYNIELESPASHLKWDLSGQYLGAALANEIKVFLNKKWTELLSAKSDKEISSVIFGKDAHFIAAASADGKVSIYANASE